jgi:hypothetical protein
MNLIRGVFLCGLVGLLLLGLWLPVDAASNKQEGTPTPTAPAVPLNEYKIPTPGANGRILYMVQPGDTCTRIALLNQITVEQLKQLNQNKLDEDCNPVIAGDTLLIGIVEAGNGTPTGPPPTAGPPTVTPTPFTGTTEICVLLFDDQNGDGFRQETEPAIEGGAISVTENNGEYSAAQDTVINPDPEAYQGICFSDVPEGSYTISVAIPDRFNATTELNYELDVNAGDLASVAFGAQSRETTVNEPDSNGGNSVSPVLGIFGILMLVSGGALGYYAWLSRKPESKLGVGRSLLKGKFFKK